MGFGEEGGSCGIESSFVGLAFDLGCRGCSHFCGGAGVVFQDADAGVPGVAGAAPQPQPLPPSPSPFASPRNLFKVARGRGRRKRKSV